MSTPASVTLHFADWLQVAEAFAADAARMTMAAFETIDGAAINPRLPKGIGWVLIHSYYAAFFAAHAISRILGRGLLMLDASAVNAINSVTALFGMQSGGGLARGAHQCVADGTKKTITLAKVYSEGTHEALWSSFTILLRECATAILTKGGTSASSARAAAKLTELVLALTNSGSVVNGTWMSRTRNRLNYQHTHGAWFPYTGRSSYYNGLTGKLRDWQKPPDSLSIWSQPGRELQQVIEVATLLLAVCRDMCQDMADRCPRGKSFQQVTALEMLRLLSAA
jgi:hypothetical protein